MGRFPKRQSSGPSIGWGSLDGNHHGPKVDGEATMLRSTFMFVPLDNGLNPPPRYFWGLRLWVYAPSGRCWNIDIAWRSARRAALSEIERERRAQLYVDQQKARGEWPPQGGVGPDYLGAMLGAVGLGLIVTERPAPAEPDEPDLPEGLWQRADGVLMCECRVCECAMPAECDPEDFDQSMAYCGGSPRCLP